MDIDPASGRQILLMEAFAFNGQYEVKATGFRGTATAGTSTNLDFAIGAEDRYINGVRLILVNHDEADTVGMQIVDVDGVYYPAGSVLKTFGVNWGVDGEVSDQGRDTYNFVARIYAGLYIRIIYLSVGVVNVTVKLNASLHKKVA